MVTMQLLSTLSDSKNRNHRCYLSRVNTPTINILNTFRYARYLSQALLLTVAVLSAVCHLQQLKYSRANHVLCTNLSGVLSRE